MREFLERALLEPFRRLAEQLGTVLPVVMTVLLILLLGGLVAYVVRRIAFRVLSWTQFDRLMDSTALGGAVLQTRLFQSPSDFAARAIQGSVWVFIILFALSAAGTPLTEGLVTRFVNYIPDMVTAGLVLLLASVISKFLARSTLLAAVNAQWNGARLLAGTVRVLVMSLGVVIALEQLRIGRTALLVTFAILLGAVAVAGAIAFGLAAKDVVRDMLRGEPVRRSAPKEEEFHHL